MIKAGSGKKAKSRTRPRARENRRIGLVIRGRPAYDNRYKISGILGASPVSDKQIFTGFEGV
jgi:hypothetical protein